MSSSFFVPAAVALLVPIIGFACFQFKKTQHLRSTRTWDQLLAQLTPVGRVGIQEVASDFLAPRAELADPRCDNTRLEPQDIWELVGGIDGLQRMEQNARVLIELACYVQRWNEEAIIVAEQLRLDAREVQTYLGRIRKAQRRGTLSTWFPIYAQRATAAYYLMTRRTLALYEVSHAGLLPALQSVI